MKGGKDRMKNIMLCCFASPQTDDRQGDQGSPFSISQVSLLLPEQAFPYPDRNFLPCLPCFLSVNCFRLTLKTPWLVGQDILPIPQVCLFPWVMKREGFGDNMQQTFLCLGCGLSQACWRAVLNSGRPHHALKHHLPVERRKEGLTY